MHSSTLRIRLIQGLLLVLTATALVSADQAKPDVDQLSSTEIFQKWGQVLFCQRIYKMPEVRSRLYDFDVEQCDQATQLVADVISKYSKKDQGQLKILAERHATALSYNTSEPYHSVGACREYCRKLADFREEHNGR